jgi:hypothetical protein
MKLSCLRQPNQLLGDQISVEAAMCTEAFEHAPSNSPDNRSSHRRPLERRSSKFKRF